MFLKNSRYFGLPTTVITDRLGRVIAAVKLRRLPQTAGSAHVVQGPDKLDVLADRTYKDATQYWHIADANTELAAGELTRVPGRVIQMPDK